MYRSILLFGLLGAASAAIGNYTVDADSVDAETKNGWCQSQYNACQTLCNTGGDGVSQNDCDTTTLVYECTCKNGTAPGLDYYKDTMEYNLCQYSYQLCIEDNEGSQSDQEACTTEIQDTCGKIDLSDATASATTSADGSSESSTATGTSDAAESTETESDDSAAIRVASYANAAGAVAIGLLAFMM